jgi:hypothetical protein
MVTYHERSDSRSLLVPLAVLWATLWVLISVIESATYIHDPSIPRWQPLTLILSLTGTITGWLTWEIYRIQYQQFPLEPPGPWILRQLARLPVLACGYLVSVFGLRHIVFSIGGAQYKHLPWQALIPFELVKVSLFYCLWLGLVYGTLSLVRSRQQGAQLALVQKALVDSQLAQLQAQLRPHFLFNTLNTVSSLMQVDIARADRVLTQLGELLRASLGAGASNTVALRAELHLVRLYAEIMQERFFGRVNLEWRIAEDVLDVQVPAMLIQPFLENAFKYGIEQTTGIETIRVTANCAHARLTIKIHNTGSALRPGWSDGLGIANSRERVRVLYGAAANMDIAEDPAGGVTASISLPAGGNNR